MKRTNQILAVAIAAAMVSACSEYENAEGEEVLGSPETAAPVATDSDMTNEVPTSNTTTVAVPRGGTANVTIGADGVDVQTNVPVDDNVNVEVDTTQ